MVAEEGLGRWGMSEAVAGPSHLSSRGWSDQHLPQGQGVPALLVWSLVGHTLTRLGWGTLGAGPGAVEDSLLTLGSTSRCCRNQDHE